MKKLVCPTSREKVDEHVVRITAFMVVLLTGWYVVSPNPYIPAFLMADFYFRGFNRSGFSMLSRISNVFNRLFWDSPRLIDKAPKIFAARIGFVCSLLMLVLNIAGFTGAGIAAGVVLSIFAFLECGLNFCAGCWVYTYIVYPFYKDR